MEVDAKTFFTEQHQHWTRRVRTWQRWLIFDGFFAAFAVGATLAMAATHLLGGTVVMAFSAITSFFTLAFALDGYRSACDARDFAAMMLAVIGDDTSK